MGERRAWLSPSSFRPLLLAAIFYLRWAGGDGGLVAAYYCCVYVCGGRPSAGGRARARGNAVLGTWLFYSSTAGCVVWDATVKHQIALLKAVAIENARICWCCSRWNRCLASFVYPIFLCCSRLRGGIACCLASLFIQFFLIYMYWAASRSFFFKKKERVAILA